MSKLLTCLGLMSGTSLDGIDIALVRTDGEHAVERGPSLTIPYDDSQRRLLCSALEQAPGLTRRDDRSGVLGIAEQALTDWHVAACRQFMAASGIVSPDIDLIGFHGQTVIHRPQKGLTVQLGDGQRLADELGVRVAFDMRAADVALGGQGAPLVPVYHQALAATLRLHPVAFVNIGGVANVTYVGKKGFLLAFDTGPGNALIDDWIQDNSAAVLDQDGAAGLAGVIDESTVAQFTGDSYFETPPPKSLDRNSFKGLSLRGLSLEDGAATLAAITARSIAMAARYFPDPPAAWIICGGGRKNAAIMRELSRLLGSVNTAEDHGLDGDSMEAEAWGYLAARCLLQKPISFPGTTGISQPSTGGIIAEPGGKPATTGGRR